MGICPGQAPMTMSSFCLYRVKTVPSEEDSASCEVLAGLIQSVIAISSAHYAFSSKSTLRQPLKNASGGKEKSSFIEVTQEIEMSSSRAVTTRKYENYYIISTFEAAISRGHKHGCLVKLIDSFLVITASCNASLKKALVRTKFSPFWQKFESFSDSGRVFLQSSRSVGVSFESLAQILFNSVDRYLSKDTLPSGGI